jgi:hypothetical protein
MPLRLGIGIACRAAHQVSLADEQGRFIRVNKAASQ